MSAVVSHNPDLIRHILSFHPGTWPKKQTRWCKAKEWIYMRIYFWILHMALKNAKVAVGLRL